MEDSQIIDLFFARSEQAICELDSKYGKTCHALSYHILHNQLDAEECVNDAYLGTWNAIPPKRPNPLLAFVCKIVRNLSIARYRANTAMKRDSSITLKDETPLAHVSQRCCFVHILQNSQHRNESP